MKVTAESLNDALQQSETPGQAMEALEGHGLTLLRAVADLNHIETEGSKAAVIRRLIADVHNG